MAKPFPSQVFLGLPELLGIGTADPFLQMGKLKLRKRSLGPKGQFKDQGSQLISTASSLSSQDIFAGSWEGRQGRS